MYQHISKPHHQKHTMKASHTLGISRRWLGVAMSVAAAIAAQASSSVTFMIDMSTETTTPTAVYISGSFNGWPAPGQGTNTLGVSTNALINVSGTIWSNTFTLTDPAGTVENCKFQDDVTGWEPLGNNRQFLAPADSTTLVLPLTTWNSNTTWPTPTNQVTFQVDMSAQVITGVFTNGNGTVTVSGDFEGWDAGLALSNNPALPGLASNVWAGTYPVAGFVGTTIHYKFRANGGWEDDQPTASKNREATITNSTQVLPLVFYNNSSLSDLMLSPTLVKFSLYCPNGTLDTGGSPFIKGTDKLYINGNFFAHDSSGTVVPAGTGGYWVWNTGIDPVPANAEMIESDVPDVYTNSFVLPAGSKLDITYKYSQDGFDDENGFQTNHYRVVRSIIPAPYTFPQDAWSWTVCPPGTPYPNPGISSTNVVEPEFGYLTAGVPVGGNIPLTWLGRQAVIIQNATSLTGGVWTDNNATDGLQATNWPNGGDNQFFRLKQKP
jgi:hypothetical protein